MISDHRMALNFLWRGVASLALCLIAFWAGLAGYWTAQREPPIRVESVELLTPEVPAGGTVRVRHTTTRFDPCHLTLERSIIDAGGVLFRLEDVSFSAGRVSVGAEEPFIETTPVPPGMRPGTARLREILVHTCNPVHRFWPVTQRMPDIQFRVTPEN